MANFFSQLLLYLGISPAAALAAFVFAGCFTLLYF